MKFGFFNYFQISLKVPYAATNNILGVVTPESCKELWIAHSQRLQSITSLGVATPNDYNSLQTIWECTLPKLTMCA